MKTLRVLVWVVLAMAVIQTVNCVLAVTGLWFGDGSLGGIEVLSFVLCWGLLALNAWMAHEIGADL